MMKPGESQNKKLGSKLRRQKEHPARCHLLLGGWHRRGCKLCEKEKMIKEKESKGGDLDLYGKDLDHDYDKEPEDYPNKALRTAT